MKKPLALVVITALLWAGLSHGGSALAGFERTPSAGGMTSALQQQSQGDCTELQVVFIVDQSGSMSQTIANVLPSDPEGLRFYGPAEAVNTLSALRYQTYVTDTMRVALIHYGDKPRLVMPWTVLTATTQSEHQKLQKDLASFFAPTASQGNTNILAAFQNASSLFDQAPPQQDACPTRAVIVITDGQPSLPAKGFSWQAHMDELARYVQRYMTPSGHRIYVIGIDKANNYWQDVKPYWDKVTGDPGKVVRADNEAHMGSLVIGIAEELARTLRPSIGRPDYEIRCVADKVAVPPFVQQVKLTLVKPSRDLHLVVLDESGRALDPSRSDISVLVDGYDEPIESLTVLGPQPGIWTITTRLPADAVGRCQIRMLSFSAALKLTPPDAGASPVQFVRLPVTFRVVDSSGAPLPEYVDPKYALKVEMSLAGPSRGSQPVTVNSKPGYEYVAEALPLEAGQNVLQAKAFSHNPDGSDYVVFDKPIATFQVAPVRLMMTQGPGAAPLQYRDLPLEFAVMADQKPVQLDLTPILSVTVAQGQEAPLALTVSASPTLTYQAAFRPEKAGLHVLTYRGVVNAPSGAVSLGEGQVAFNVLPVRRVTARIVAPVREHFLATDILLRPKGLPLEVQLLDESGQEIGPGEVGAVNPMVVFGVKVLDAQHNVVGARLKLVNTGKPGLFRLESNTLGPGRYEVIVEPATALAQDAVWAESSWTRSFYGDIDRLFFALLAGVLLVVALIVGLVLAVLATRRHPLSGYIEVYQEVPDQAGSYQVSVLKRQLPRRNRVRMAGSGKESDPLRRITLTCDTEEDSKAGLARARIELKDGNTLAVMLGPAFPATSLGLGFYIAKGPRSESAPGVAGPGDTFGKATHRR